MTAFVALAAARRRTGSAGSAPTLSSTWFQALTLEGEAARLPGETPDACMTSFTGAALLAPPIGIFTPYGGLGLGVFRQTLGRGQRLRHAARAWSWGPS